jgi:hypothetical protein
MRFIGMLLMVLAFIVAGFAQSIPPSNVPPYYNVPDITRHPDLSGKWAIKWLISGLPNRIVLEDTGGGLKGHFIAGNKEECPVSGDYSRVEGIHIQVRCKKWTAELLGQLQSDGGTILGIWLIGSNRGKFRMERVYCMLPEGCN